VIPKLFELPKTATMRLLKQSRAYIAVSEFYGGQRAKRSQVPMMNHINEGLVILYEFNASGYAMEAFCLHPLIQRDEDLKKNWPLKDQGLDAALLAMEYRSVANAYLSHHQMPAEGIRLSPLSDVNDMLIADKVQNLKDFRIYHENSHPRSSRLAEYFKQWLDALGVPEVTVEYLVKRIQ
jgi:hypothetical protein